MSRTARSNIAQSKCEPPVTNEAMIGQKNSAGCSHTFTGTVEYSASPEKTRNGEGESKSLTFNWHIKPNAALLAATFNPAAKSGFLAFMELRNSINLTAR